MSKKEFLVEVSFSGRMIAVVNAESEEEAKEIIFDECVLEFKDTENVGVEEVEWDMLEREPGGNIAVPFIRNMHIEELE